MAPWIDRQDHSVYRTAVSKQKCGQLGKAGQRGNVTHLRFAAQAYCLMWQNSRTLKRGLQTGFVRSAAFRLGSETGNPWSKWGGGQFWSAEARCGRGPAFPDRDHSGVELEASLPAALQSGSSHRIGELRCRSVNETQMRFWPCPACKIIAVPSTAR